MKTQQTQPDKYTLGPDCDSSCLDQGIRVCGHEFSIKHHLDDCKQTETPSQAPQASHSPLPWAIRVTRANAGAPKNIRICDHIGLTTAMIHGSATAGVTVESVNDRKEANAAFIVRACNEYETLTAERDRLRGDLNRTISGNNAEILDLKAHAQRLSDALAKIKSAMEHHFSPLDRQWCIRAAREALAQWSKDNE